MSDQLIRFVRDHFQTNEFIPLHAPVFPGREKEYVADTIESTFVSSVGAYVDRFERDMADYTGSPKAVATVNGTASESHSSRQVVSKPPAADCKP